MKLIVAVDEKWGIGKDGDLLTSIPDDMLYYRATTRGRVVVMGYTTLLSLPKSKPAPGRLNLVLADIEGLRIPGAIVCGSMEQLHRMIGQFAPDDVFDIGGGSMYRQLLPYCSDAHITKMRFDGGADTFIPNLDELPAWSVADESELKDHEGLQYSFVVYHNAAPEPLTAAEELSTDMSAYFKKRGPVTVKLSDDRQYRAELHALLNAYFYPLGNGFGADDVARFLGGGQGTSFERYLRDHGLIAAPENITALTERFCGDGYTVTVDKERFPNLDSYFRGDISAAQAAQMIAE